jgi:hypothetical protein
MRYATRFGALLIPTTLVGIPPRLDSTGTTSTKQGHIWRLLGIMASIAWYGRPTKRSETAIVVSFAFTLEAGDTDGQNDRCVCVHEPIISSLVVRVDVGVHTFLGIESRPTAWCHGPVLQFLGFH